MSWLNGPAQARELTLTQHLQRRPHLQEKYSAFIETLWNSERVPLRLLELCRLRLAAIHGCQEQWQQRRDGITLSADDLAQLQRGALASFSVLEQQALTLAELMPHAHHEITDQQIAALRPQLDDAGIVSLLTALAFFDVNARMSCALGASATNNTEPGVH